MSEQILRLVVGLDTARAKAETDQYAQHFRQAQASINAQAEALRQRQEQSREAAAEREKTRQREIAAASIGRAQELLEQRKRLAVAAIEDEGRRRQAQIELQYNTELENVRQLLAVRRQAGEITGREYLDELRRFESQLAAVRDRRLSGVSEQSGRALGGVADQGARANQVIQSFGFIMNDAQQAQYGFRQAVVATSNNLPIFLNQIVEMGRAARASGTTVTASLVSSLSGVGGLIAVLNLAATAFVLFGSRGEEATDKVADGARKAKDRIDSLVSSILTFNDTPLRFEIDAQDVSGVLATFEARVAETRRRLAADTRAESIGSTEGRDNTGLTGGALGARAAAQEGEEVVRLSEAQRTQLEGQLAIQETIVAQLREQQELQRGLADAAAELTDAGLDGETDQDRDARLRAEREAQKALTKAERDAQRERERLAEQARQRVQRQSELIAELRVATVEDEVARARAALNAWYQEQLALARGNVEAVALVRQRRDQRATEIEEGARERARQALEEQAELDERRARLAGATAVQVAEARIQRLEEYIAAEAVLGGELDELLAERERAVLDRDEAEAESARELAEVRQRAAERIGEVEERRARLAGSTEEDVLADRVARIEAEVAAAEDGTARKLELEAELAEARIDLDEKVAESAEAAEKRRLQAAERYIGSVLDALDDELTRRKRFTEEDIEAETTAFEAKRAELDEDLRRRKISQAEYDAEVRALNADRADFERELAEDQRDVIGAMLEEVTALFRQAARDAIAAEMAKAVASQIASVIGTIPFPLNLVAVGGAVAATTALGALIPAFETGGLVTGGPRIIQVNEAGPEFVLNASATRGNEVDLYRLQFELAQGRRLRDLLPGFADGGLTTRLDAPPQLVGPAVAAPASAAVGGAGLADRLDQLVAEVARLAQPRVVSDPEARRLDRRARREARIRRGTR